MQWHSVEHFTPTCSSLGVCVPRRSTINHTFQFCFKILSRRHMQNMEPLLQIHYCHLNNQSIRCQTEGITNIGNVKSNENDYAKFDWRNVEHFNSICSWKPMPTSNSKSLPEILPTSPKQKFEKQADSFLAHLQVANCYEPQILTASKKVM